MLVERIAHQTGWSVNRLMDFSRSAGRKYKVFEIPKRSGGKRVIEQPSKSVKAIQRWLSRSLFSKYQIHPAAHAYRKDVSVRDNALVHSKYNYTLRVDFKDFFWSFLSDDVSRFFRNNLVPEILLTEIDIEFVVNMVTREGPPRDGRTIVPNLD